MVLSAGPAAGLLRDTADNLHEVSHIVEQCHFGMRDLCAQNFGMRDQNFGMEHFSLIALLFTATNRVSTNRIRGAERVSDSW